MATAVCCNQCFEVIVKKDTTAGKLWLDLCAYFVKLGGVFFLNESRVPSIIQHLRNLEMFGYITTADGEDAVKLRVNGYDIIEIENENRCLDTFCINREEHFSSWL